MPTLRPICKDQRECIFYVFYAGAFYKITLNAVFINFLEDGFIGSGGVEYKRDALFAKFGIVIDLLLEFNTGHFGQIHVAEDNEGLDEVGFGH